MWREFLGEVVEGVVKGVVYTSIGAIVILLLMRACVEIAEAQEVDVRINTWNRTIMSPGWPVRSSGSETLAHYGYVQIYMGNGARIVKEPQDFYDFMRGQCESTNSFWIGAAEKAKNDSKRQEALGYLQNCWGLYPPAWE